MKRDLDLCRNLLLEIENGGADCSVSVLRAGADQDSESRVRHHLRLLIDGGYLKEVDRTTDGVPCVRLTDIGHELVELARVESRWREAKWICQQRSGGLSLTVVRNILLQWAVPPAGYARARRYYAASPAPAPAITDADYAPAPAYRLEPVREGTWEDTTDGVRYLRVRPQERNGWRVVEGPRHGEFVECEVGAALPEYLL